MTKKKVDKQSVEDKLEEFLVKHKVSGLFHIPGEGTISIFCTSDGGFRVLEQAEIELMVRDKILSDKAMNRACDILTQNDSKPIKKEMGYIG